MKTFLPIFILFISISTYAQNYRTANITETSYYEDSINWFSSSIPFKAANFNAQTNGDTLINFMENFNNPYTYDSAGLCIDTASVGWQGEKVLLKLDGTDIYYNINNEPITIKTQANINDTWLFFDGNVRFEATLLQIANQPIFGVTDSIKTFSIQAIDANNNPITNPLNNTTYQFSKNYGWITAPDFYHFPSDIKHDLNGLQNTKLGVYNIIKNDVYNFNIGDEFHIKDGTMFEKHYYKVIILTKQLDVNNDWEYTYDVARHVFWEYDDDTNSPIVTEITSGVIPQQVVPQNIVDLSPLPMTFYQDNSGVSAFNHIEKSPILDRNQKVLDGANWMNNNGCWTYGFLLGVSHIDTYIEGLGGPYGGSSVSGSGRVVSLEYYKSGNEIYGTPINFDLIMPTETVISESENMNIYPNPAQDFINIELESQSNLGFNILIVNNLGQVVQQDRLTQNIQQIPVNHLPKGIYTLQVKNEETVYVKRFIKN